MSRIDFRSGDLLGRLTGMVGASWKGINYVRKMVIPANPNTAAQQGTRTVFAWLVDKGRRINSTVLKPSIFPVPKKKSQFNEFLSRNKAMIAAGVVTVADMIIGAGGLFVPPNYDAAINSPAKEIDFTWDTDLEGEALATDPIVIAVWNETRNVWFFVTGVRSSGAENISDPGMVAGNVYHTWMFATQGTLINSETSYVTDTSI